MELPTGPCRSRTALFGAVALGGGFEGVDEVVQMAIQAVDGVAVPAGKFGEELVARHFFLLFVTLFGAVRQDHVVQPLVGGAGHFGMFADDARACGRPYGVSKTSSAATTRNDRTRLSATGPLMRFTMGRSVLHNQHHRERRESTLSMPHNCLDCGGRFTWPVRSISSALFMAVILECWAMISGLLV